MTDFGVVVKTTAAVRYRIAPVAELPNAVSIHPLGNNNELGVVVLEIRRGGEQIFQWLCEDQVLEIIAGLTLALRENRTTAAQPSEPVADAA